MTVPGRVAAAALLLSLDPPSWFLHHARAVAEVAAWLALRLEQHDVRVDRPLVEAAALLHDADKLLPATDPARRLRHGEGSAAWLARTGHPELGPAVANHPVTRLADRDAFLAWLASASHEEKVVAYADKRAGQRLESVDARFRSWGRRYPDGWPGEPPGMVRQHATLLEAEVCRLAGVLPQHVARLRWTDGALRAARAAS
jgi:HD superfamily phosphodiesterase